MKQMDFEQIRDAIERAERDAAHLILQAHGILAETKSGKRDVVTAYDRRVQAFLIKRLREAVPSAVFYCEELIEDPDARETRDEPSLHPDARETRDEPSLHPDARETCDVPSLLPDARETGCASGLRGQPDAAQLFIIDPIDGTMNFVHGFHHSCISVAYAEGGTVQIGVIYNPYADEMFSAVRGSGARLNGRAISVTDAGLSESIVCFGSAPYNPELADETFRLVRKAFDAGLDVRREGAAALDLCTVAAGRAGLYFEMKISLWDYAAGALIVEEAGGRCCTLSGDSLPADGRRTSVLAGSRIATEEFLADLKG